MAVETVTVNWKCGACDVMHTSTYGGTDEERTDAVELVGAILLANDGNPHLSIMVTRDGVTEDETMQVLIAMITVKLIEDGIVESLKGMF